MLKKDPRLIDNKYLAWIRQQPCCICGNNVSVEAAHLRVGSINHGKSITGMAMKSSDKWALPLCCVHHRRQHAAGNELEFWASYGINPFELSISYQSRRSNASR